MTALLTDGREFTVVTVDGLSRASSFPAASALSASYGSQEPRVPTAIMWRDDDGRLTNGNGETVAQVQARLQARVSS
jgi:hypothetical protein